MARPKGKMIALLAVFVAIALVAATGAFTSVEAERTVSVNVSDDSDALLQMEPSDGPNGDYATQSGTTIEINLDDSSDADGAGINDNATTVITKIFNVTNQGTQDVDITAEYSDNNDSVNVYVLSNATNAGTGGDVNLSASSSEVTELGTGNSTAIGLKIVTEDATDTSFTGDLTLTAEDSDAS